MFPDDFTITKCVWYVCSVFTLIENNAESHDMRSDSTRVTRLAPQEQMIEVGLMSTFNSIVQMCSSAIYDVSPSPLALHSNTRIYSNKNNNKHAYM